MRANANDRSSSTGDQPTRPDRAAATGRFQESHPVTSVPEALSPRQAGELQRSIGNAAVVRLVQRARGEDAQDPARVQRSSVHAVLRAPGRALDGPLRQEMEARLGADFSDVRVHTGPAAQRSAAEIGARAYTSGSNVVIGPGGGDKHTLAHELTHVIQQRRGPVSGTDNGSGLSVSHPSDAFERAAEANATRVMAGPVPQVGEAEHAHTGAEQHSTATAVQRMMGFEVEIDLPVQDAAGQKYAGDTDLAESTAQDFKVVSDSRTLKKQPGEQRGGKYSNLEFVTGAVSVVGSQQAAGRETLNRLVDEIAKVRDALYEADDQTPLLDVAVDLRVLDEGAKVAPGLPYKDHTDGKGNGGLFVHYSVGVPLSGMPSFFDSLRAEAPAPEVGRPYHRARFRLGQASQFAKEVVALYDGLVEEPEDKRKGTPDTDALDGYCQLYFMQVAAAADKLAQDDAGLMKNLTAVLSRSSLFDVRKLLDATFRTFLRKNSEEVIEILSNYQEQSGNPGEKLQFNDNYTAEAQGQQPVKLIDFAKSGLTGKKEVSQQRLFGGMNEIAPHQEEDGAWMVPFEIRTMGATMKTWDDLRRELLQIASWAQTSYQHDRELADSQQPARKKRG